MAIAGVTDYTNTYAANRTSYNAKGSSGLSETAQFSAVCGSVAILSTTLAEIATLL